MWLPTVAVYSDGVWLADGRDLESTDPQVLTDLAVRWGRSTVVDQPQPSTCNLTLSDREGGQRFLDLLHVGGRLDVTADALLGGEETGDETTVVIDEDFAAGIGDAFKLSGNATVSHGPGYLHVECLGVATVTVVIPPAPRQPVNGDPTAWDDVPRALTGQTWHAAMDVRWPPPFAGYDGWNAVVRPCSFNSPWADPVLLDPLPPGFDTGADWTHFEGDFQPTANAWLGVAVELHPTGPTWDELPLAPITPVARTNQAPNPRATASGTDGWLGTRGFGSGGGAGTYSYATGMTPAPAAGVDTARRKTWTTSPTDNVNSGFQVDASSAGRFPVTAGDTITVSAYLRHGSATTKLASMRLQFRDAASAVVGATLAGDTVTLPVGTGWSRIAHTVTVPATAVTMSVFPDILTGGGGLWAVGNTLDATALLIEVGNNLVSPYFDGDTADLADTAQYDWTGTANASTSTVKGFGVTWDAMNAGQPYENATTWDALGLFAVDNVLLTAPDTGTVRLGMVFSGRITDLEAWFDEDVGATRVDVTAADQRAELGNRDVGDEPWNEEPIGTRFQRIVAASGQPIESRVSPTAAAYMVSWRDVDRQPAMRLLDELATSADGVLWAATHPTTGPYLQLESMSDRVALFVLEKSSGDGLIRIVAKTVEQTGAVEIDSCSILLEPVRWRHDIEDVATRVAVTWREQTTDDEGKIKPTDRVESLSNPTLEGAIGVRRIAIATQLSRGGDAASIADAVLGRTGTSQWRISGLEWHVDKNDDPVPENDLGVLMRLLDGTSRNGLPIILTNLPSWSPVGSDRLALFLEGGVYQSHNGAWQLKLIVSSATTVGDSVTWNELPPNPGWAWDDFAPEVRWIDLGGVAAP